MTPSRLSIAYGDEPSKRADAVSELLRRQGHEVVGHDDQESFLSAPQADL